MAVSTTRTLRPEGPCNDSGMTLFSKRDLLPPIAINSFHDFRAGRREYRSLVEAQNAAASSNSSTYSSDALTKTVVEKTELFRSSAMVNDQAIASGEFALLAATLRFRDLMHLSVLDFGGAAGASYYRARPWISATSVDWRVVETNAMVEAARSGAPAELSFHTTLSAATTGWTKPPELVLLSSTLQYLDDPEVALTDLVNMGPEVLLLARTPLAESNRSHIVLQRSRLSENGPGPLPTGTSDCSVAYPATYVPLEMVRHTLDTGYRHIHHIVEQSRLRALRGGVVIGQHSFIAHGPRTR